MELYAGCQGFDTGFNVKFAKKYCPGVKNPGQYHEAKSIHTIYHNMKYRRNNSAGLSSCCVDGKKYKLGGKNPISETDPERICIIKGRAAPTPPHTK